LTKYNALTFWGVYWLGVLIYSLMKKNFTKAFARLVVVNVSFAFLIILFTGGINRLIYVGYNLFFWAVQPTLAAQSGLYYFLVLIEGLSPLLFVVELAALVFLGNLILKKNYSRYDFLLFFTSIVFVMVLSLQARKFPRYLIVLLPIISISVSRMIVALGRQRKIMATVLVVMLVVFAGGWSVYRINLEDDNEWKEASDFLKGTDKQVFVDRNNIEPLRYYSELKPEEMQFVGKSSKGDFIVLEQGLANSPFEENLMFYEAQKPNYSGSLEKYIEDNSQEVYSVSGFIEIREKTNNEKR